MPEPDPAASHPRPAFYALAPGGWRDWWTLLHPPYTRVAPLVRRDRRLARGTVDVRWLVETLLAFFLAMGLAAHALDELHGRPLGTRIPELGARRVAVVGLAGAVALGIDGMVEVSPWLGAFIVAGAFLVVAYNLELFGGAFHSDLWFALAWGAFPVLTAAFAQTATVSARRRAGRRRMRRAERGAARALDAGPPSPSPRRRGRRTLRLDDGREEPVVADSLRAAPEGALRLLSVAVPALAAAMLVARLA